MLIPGVHTPLAGKKKKALRPPEMQWPSAGLFSASPHQCPCTRGAPRGVRGGVGGSAPFASLRSDPGMIGQGQRPPFAGDGTSRASPMGVLILKTPWEAERTQSSSCPHAAPDSRVRATLATPFLCLKAVGRRPVSIRHIHHVCAWCMTKPCVSAPHFPVPPSGQALGDSQCRRGWDLCQ